MDIGPLAAASFAEAIEIFGKERVGCLTIDLGLGAESGLDLLQLIAPQDRKIEILIISGASGALLESTRNFADQKGVPLFDLFPKPLDLVRLRESVKRAREACWMQQQAEA